MKIPLHDTEKLLTGRNRILQLKGLKFKNTETIADHWHKISIINLSKMKTARAVKTLKYFNRFKSECKGKLISKVQISNVGKRIK